TKRILYTAGVWFMGWFTYLLMLYLLADLFSWISRKMSGRGYGKGTIFGMDRRKEKRRKVLFLMTLLATAVTVYGGLHAKDVTTVRYDVAIDKPGGNLDALNVVMVSDIHLGYIVGKNDIEKMTAAIRALDPDLVIIAGDIFDDNLLAVRELDEIKALLQGIESTYGTFAALGNHDAGRTYPEMVQFLQDSGIVLLQDEGVLVGESFFLAGRKDFRPIGDQGDVRKPLDSYLSAVDKTRPFLMIDHQPVALEDAQAVGVDLLLSGHSHKGQIFPGRIFTRMIYRNDWGYLRMGSLHSVVSSGFGTRGPPLRVGTDSEVVQIMVEFQP
ncbi:MAG TPA: metallophosphoesterase, partial [Clostridiaceae bacterium]|nr:metallophosphoesterase [Clostridiaceae bacterium]